MESRHRIDRHTCVPCSESAESLDRGAQNISVLGKVTMQSLIGIFLKIPAGPLQAFYVIWFVS